MATPEREWDPDESVSPIFSYNPAEAKQIKLFSALFVAIDIRRDVNQTRGNRKCRDFCKFMIVISYL